MHIALITPAPHRSRAGNRFTARRWGEWLRAAGHRVEVAVTWNGRPADLMLALHARRSFASIAAFHARYPERPLVVTLTGTDLYRDIATDPDAQQALAWADRLIVLQEAGFEALPVAWHDKTRVVYQSAVPGPQTPPAQRHVELCVIGHLRAEKDPFCAARALQWLPAASRIRLLQIGEALDAGHAQEARHWQASEPRYRWLGGLSHGETLRRLARSRALIVSSHMEGGANVICEAVMTGIPVLASDISGNRGMLGAAYAGLYPAGDAAALAALMQRAEQDAVFLATLRAQCAQRRPLFEPDHEAAALINALGGLSPPRSPPCPARPCN